MQNVAVEVGRLVPPAFELLAFETLGSGTSTPNSSPDGVCVCVCASERANE